MYVLTDELYLGKLINLFIISNPERIGILRSDIIMSGKSNSSASSFATSSFDDKKAGE
jgi:hypothetical protein